MSEQPEQPKFALIKLKSGDGEIFEVGRPIAMRMNLVKSLLEENEELENLEILIDEVNAVMLGKVVEYCHKNFEHEENQIAEDEIERWEKEFIEVIKPTLFQLVTAAEILEVEPLLNLLCYTPSES